MLPSKTFSILPLWKGTNWGRRRFPHGRLSCADLRLGGNWARETICAPLWFSSCSFVSWFSWPKIHTLPDHRASACTALGFPFLALTSLLPARFSCRWIKQLEMCCRVLGSRENECRDKDHRCLLQPDANLKMHWIFYAGLTPSLCTVHVDWAIRLIFLNSLPASVFSADFLSLLSKDACIPEWLGNNLFFPPRNV